MDGVELGLAQQRNPDLVAEGVCMGHPVQADFVLAAPSGHAGEKPEQQLHPTARRVQHHLNQPRAWAFHPVTCCSM